MSLITLLRVFIPERFSSGKYWGVDKSLAPPGRKQATATKLQILQATQKIQKFFSVQPGLRASNDLRVGRKVANFQLFFFQSSRAKDLSAPFYVCKHTSTENSVKICSCTVKTQYSQLKLFKLRMNR